MVPSAIDGVLPSGAEVDGRYVIQDVIAWGGMGVVYRAIHKVLGNEVALKTMRREIAADENAFVRFVREARNAAKLTSRHVARVFDFGRMPNGEPYLVMELLRGEDLAGWLGSKGALSNERTIEILIQTCDALAEAHAAGIIHRDLKPENLFIADAPNGKSEVKVLDFGLSKNKRVRGRVLTLVGRGMGSPNYMAPEQMRGKADLDHRADIWSLGAVAYELLSGEPAFPGETVPEICAKVLSERPAPLSQVSSGVWPELSDIVERCLEPNPELRYESVAELRVALERARGGQPEEIDDADIVALDDEDDEPIRIAGLKPRRWTKLTAAALGAGMAAAGVWGLWSGQVQMPEVPHSVMSAIGLERPLVDAHSEPAFGVPVAQHSH
jgi:serine/threonine-protein kinase